MKSRNPAATGRRAGFRESEAGSSGLDVVTLQVGDDNRIEALR